MSEYYLEGGPHDGTRVTIEGTPHILRMPVRRPLNVLSMSRGPQLTMDIAEYVHVGRVYRWDRLIGDALASVDVSAEYARLPEARREVRRMLRRHLEELAEGKEVDRIVWRILPDPRTFRFRFTALAGGRRVEFGLAKRSKRRP